MLPTHGVDHSAHTLYRTAMMPLLLLQLTQTLECGSRRSQGSIAVPGRGVLLPGFHARSPLLLCLQAQMHREFHHQQAAAPFVRDVKGGQDQAEVCMLSPAALE